MEATSLGLARHPNHRHLTELPHKESLGNPTRTMRQGSHGRAAALKSHTTLPDGYRGQEAKPGAVLWVDTNLEALQEKKREGRPVSASWGLVRYLIIEFGAGSESHLASPPVGESGIWLWYMVQQWNKGAAE
jgi:hypothetical protein